MENKRRLRLIREINFHCRTNALLAINPEGILMIIYCPFKAVTLWDMDFFYKGEIVTVEAVKMNAELLLVYVINGLAYYYFNFSILLPE